MSRDQPDVATDWIQTFAGRHCLVTGGAGVIGRVLVVRLLEAGAKVTVIDPADKPAEFPLSASLCHHRTRVENLPDPLGRGLEPEPEYVFHLAASFQRTAESADFLSRNFRDNVAAAHRLAVAAAGWRGFRAFVFASSYLGYDETLYLGDAPPHEPVILPEEAPLRPRNLTGAAKLLHETELEHLQRHHPAGRFVSARICRVYGRGSKDVLSRWIRAALTGGTIRAYGLESFFDYIHADDVAEGLLRLAAHPRARGAFNLGSGGSRRVGEALEVIRQAIPEAAVKAVEPPEGFRWEASQVGMSRTFGLLPGFRPRRIEEGIADVIAHERAQATGDAAPRTKASPPRATAVAVLLTSAGAKKPLYERLGQALHAVGAEGRVIAGDADSSCALALAGGPFIQLPSGTALTPEAFLGLCHEHGITHVVPSRDGELAFFAALAARGGDGIHFFVTGREALATCLDKLAFAEAGERLGLPVVPTATSPGALETERFVVKERHGAGGRGIGLNLSREEAEAWARPMREPVFQPFIAGREFSADSYARPGGERVGTVPRWRERVVGGESHVSSTFHDARIENLVTGALSALGVTHHSVTQGIVDEAGTVHLLEVNCRWGGASALSAAVGLRSLEWWLRESREGPDASIAFAREAGEARLVRFPDQAIHWLG